jgi:hypothetical protein
MTEPPLSKRTRRTSRSRSRSAELWPTSKVRHVPQPTTGNRSRVEGIRRECIFSVTSGFARRICDAANAEVAPTMRRRKSVRVIVMLRTSNRPSCATIAAYHGFERPRQRGHREAAAFAGSVIPSCLRSAARHASPCRERQAMQAHFLQLTVERIPGARRTGGRVAKVTWLFEGVLMICTKNRAHTAINAPVEETWR